MKVIALTVQKVSYLIPRYAQALAVHEAELILKLATKTCRVDITTELGKRIAHGLRARGAVVETRDCPLLHRRRPHLEIFRDEFLDGASALHLIELDPDARGVTYWVQAAKDWRIPRVLHKMWVPVDGI